ncbi:MAG: hypothetical protein ACXWN5_02955 [Candidatus Limnocylindrales bacterium]
MVPGRPPPGAGRPPEGVVLTRHQTVAGERGSKGRRLDARDLAVLATPGAVEGEAGRRSLTLLVLEHGEVHEDDAALRLAAAVAGPGLVLRGPAESRVDLLAAADGVARVEIAALERLDRLDPLEVFTVYDGQVVGRGELVASVKVAPHAVPASILEQAERLVARVRPLVRVAVFRRRRVAALVKESLHAPARARFEASVRLKVESLGSELIGPLYVADELEPVEAALRGLTSGPPPAELIHTPGGASTDPADPFFVALERLGGRIVRHGVPAHPGSMLWLGRLRRSALLGLPTCGAYSKATAADLLLPWLLAGEPADRRTVARLGHGGILTRQMRFRLPPYARTLEAPAG